MSNVLDILAPMLREVNGVLSLCVDGSALSEIHRCPRASYYKLIRRRISAKEDRALIFGRVCAITWDWRYRTYGNQPVPPEDQHLQDAVIDKAYAELEPAYEREESINANPFGDRPTPTATPDPFIVPVEENGKRSYLHAGRCKDVMRLYNQEYGEEPFKVVATERPFETPLGCVTIRDASYADAAGFVIQPTTYRRLPVIWEGRYDMVIRNDYGEWVFDAKTSGYWATDEGDPWKEWRNSSACKGYAFHRWKETGVLPFGWIIQAAIVRPPLKKESSRSLPRNQFERQEFPFNGYGEQVLLEWQRNTLSTLQAWVRMAEEEYWPMHDRNGFTCKWCSYLKLCTTHDEKTREMLLIQDVSYRYNDWSPQTQVNVK